MPLFRDSASVRVPATSANLGPGFDALGLALDLCDEVSATVTTEGLQVDVSGEGAGIACDETHLVVRAMRAAFDALGGQPTGIALDCVNRIPHSRGLGSSAAAIVAGVWLARALVDGGEALLPDDEALALAGALEGHPDNVAACVLGGLTIAWTDEAGTAHAVSREPVAVRPVVFVPPSTASTEHARGLLPATVSHRDAAANAGRAALLVAALTGEPSWLLAATEDRLHQHYREPAMPESYALVQRLREHGLPAVISGAGPTVLVLAAGQEDVDAALATAPSGWRCEQIAVAPGVQVR